MFTKLRKHFGIPGILAIAALVFAMIGGAYAASDQGGGKATASAKGKRGKQGPRGKRGPTGPTGPAGAPGAQGPAGAKGDAGANGANGDKGATGPTGPTGPTGADGTSVKVKALTAGAQVQCEETGGALVEEEKVGGAKVPVCTGEQGEDGEPGEDGQPWVPDNTLPVGATLTGAWSFNASTADSTFTEEASQAYATISFPIKLAAGLDETKVHFQGEGDFSTKCPGGTPANPTAPSGHLCVYRTASNMKNASPALVFEFAKPFASVEGGPGEVGPTGGVLVFKATGNPASGLGSWAVTGF